jgi:hypothetical protein
MYHGYTMGIGEINDDLDVLFGPEILNQRKTYALRPPPRFASRGL